MTSRLEKKTTKVAQFLKRPLHVATIQFEGPDDGEDDPSRVVLVVCAFLPPGLAEARRLRSGKQWRPFPRPLCAHTAGHSVFYL